MLRSWFLVVMVCSSLMGEDAAAYAAHIGGATRPEHLTTLVERAADLTPDVRGRLITRLGLLRMPDALPLLERLLPFADEPQALEIIDQAIAMRHARAVPLLLAVCRVARPTVQARAWEQMWYHPFTEDQAGNPLLRDFLRTCLADAQHPQRVSAALILHAVGVGDEIRAAAEVILAVPPSTDPLRYTQRRILAERGDPRLFPLVLPDLRADFNGIGHNAQVNAAMDIGTALRAGAPLDDATRQVLLHTIRVCPHYDPTSFAAEALRDARDQASYPVLLELFGHTQSDEPVAEALCAIDPQRAAADWPRLLRDADESRRFSARLYGPQHRALRAVFTGIISRPADGLEEAERDLRREVLSRILSSGWEIEETRQAPDDHLVFIKRYLHDDDLAVVRDAARAWTEWSPDDLPDDTVTQVRKAAEGDDVEARRGAWWVMSRRPGQFAAEVARMVRTTEDQHIRFWLLRGCCTHGGILPVAELIDRAFAHHQQHPNGSELVAWYAALFATRSGEDHAFELLFTPDQRSDQQRALLMQGAVRGVRALRLNSFVRRWDLLDDGLRAALVDAVANSERDHARFSPLAARLSGYATTRDTARMIAGMTALARHDLTVTPDDLIHDLMSYGLAHLAGFWPEGEHSAWGEWRRVLLGLVKSTGASIILTDSVLHALVDPDQRQRGQACVMVQLEAAVGPLATYLTDPLRPQLFHIATTDVPGVRGEAARALAAMARAEDFTRLAELFLADPVNRIHFAAALRASDPRRAEEFFQTERARLHLDELNIGLKGQAPAP